MERDWERLSAAVLKRRATQQWTQQQVWDRGGPSDTLQSDIEGKRWKPTRNVKETLRKIDVGLEWMPGSAARVLAGGDPTPVTRHDVTRRGAEENQTGLDQLFERVGRLVSHAHESIRGGDYLGAIHGLEGVESTVELLIERISDKIRGDQSPHDAESLRTARDVDTATSEAIAELEVDEDRDDGKQLG
ncbi:hypothetical protein DSM43518_04836 [Mycobacterium marinum]|uniref:hypothetical protein n=1 Tax=Mycobacterium marinum TaxID=1781 RepID=UPI000CD9EA07|nr:hypothetical protein [Mycobacterium marinum]AXN51294.1 hypothetical protein CCUG20998_03898 [Mycobacterium marinum]RFZ02849.1 hypothetical protein DSM43518_04836 [Mycobacterium marinum]RFZ26040.1 hypothetical protein DSM43519_01354 [Mycobacterium marinum]RFZ28919.1 hypothetical protein DSM44344_01186 [Mycobacterium marinum]RFZ39105.1 hypothetical protein NCTC2275_00373 [Mycobacterium marinum]